MATKTPTKFGKPSPTKPAAEAPSQDGTTTSPNQASSGGPYGVSGSPIQLTAKITNDALALYHTPTSGSTVALADYDNELTINNAGSTLMQIQIDDTSITQLRVQHTDQDGASSDPWILNPATNAYEQSLATRDVVSFTVTATTTSGAEKKTKIILPPPPPVPGIHDPSVAAPDAGAQPGHGHRMGKFKFRKQ